MGISSTIPRQRIGRGLHDIGPHPHFTVGRLSESILEFQVLNGSICPLPSTDSHVYGSCDLSVRGLNIRSGFVQSLALKDNGHRDGTRIVHVNDHGAVGD